MLAHNGSVVGFVIVAAAAIFLAALVVMIFVGGVDCCCRGRCWTGVIKACSTSHPSGNQVDGLPLVAHTSAVWFGTPSPRNISVP